MTSKIHDKMNLVDINHLDSVKIRDLKLEFNIMTVHTREMSLIVSTCTLLSLILISKLTSASTNPFLQIPVKISVPEYEYEQVLTSTFRKMLHS